MSYKPLINFEKQKNTAKIMTKLFNNENLKEKFNNFFTNCVENMEFELINLYLSYVRIK